MSYCYEKEKPVLFTENGQENFLKVRDSVHSLLDKAGAFREDAVEHAFCASWEQMAALDRLVELGEIVVVRNDCWRQYRVYSTSKIHNR
jgi:hypothetical protein